MFSTVFFVMLLCYTLVEAQPLPVARRPQQPNAVSQPSQLLFSTKNSQTPIPPPRPSNRDTKQNKSTVSGSIKELDPNTSHKKNINNQSLDPLERMNSYLNSFKYLSGKFTQTTSQGKQSSGDFSISRPGKIYFSYQKPVNLEIIADGKSVAVRDKKLNTQDLYLISQTPLKFLLAAKVDLQRDFTIKNAAQDNNYLTVSFSDQSTFGGTSQITLKYSLEKNSLIQWSITDPQGIETTVNIFALDIEKSPRSEDFIITYDMGLERDK